METTEPKTTKNTADPIGLLEQVSADAVRERIAELDDQRRALVVLLRAARARERREARVTPGCRPASTAAGVPGER
jgi:hypothetical protein